MDPTLPYPLSCYDPLTGRAAAPRRRAGRRGGGGTHGSPPPQTSGPAGVWIPKYSLLFILKSSLIGRGFQEEARAHLAGAGAVGDQRENDDTGDITRGRGHRGGRGRTTRNRTRATTHERSHIKRLLRDCDLQSQHASQLGQHGAIHAHHLCRDICLRISSRDYLRNLLQGLL